jgi:hypothetical protein
MRKYIITEDQIERLLNENTKIKKGIAIKFKPGGGQEDVYTSIIKEFNSLTEFDDYKNSLGKKKEIIGIIDIKD